MNKLFKACILISLIAMLILATTQNVFAGKPKLIKVAVADSLGSWKADSTTVTRYTVDLRGHNIDISQNMMAYWKVSSAVGAINCAIYVKWAPFSGTTFETNVDSIKLHATRTVETAESDTLFVPFGARYLNIYADPNLGATVTGISDTVMDFYLIGQEN